jgi:DNA primase
MRFPPQFLDELRARLPVSEVVGRRVQLKKRGREYVGLSPFNREKTPSFTVNDQKGFFHDFSSGKHGDIFGFLMETEGLSFPEAVERLAGLAGLPLPEPSDEGRAREQRRQSIDVVLELAAKFFEETLASRAATKARAYLADRGIDPEMQRRFRLGYAAPERYALKEHLGGKGIGVPDMIDAGLLIAGEDIAVPFDRFRDRVIFPIADSRSRVIAFGGRALSSDVQPKYLNSPETAVFHKGATLYNIAAARAAAHRGAALVVVEGYVDVIAMAAAGYDATVAPLGTALTEEQLRQLWRMSDEPVLCFDGDQAGGRAANRAMEIALPQLDPGKSLRFAMLPAGQDPDDLFRSGGRAAIDEVIGAARPLSEMLWLRETGGGLDTPERRAALEARLAALTSGIRNETVRRHYAQDLATRLDQLFSVFASQAGGRSGPGGRRPQPWRKRSNSAARPEFLGQRSRRFAASPILRRSALPPREALILLAILNHPWLLEAHAEELAEIEFRNADADRLRRALLDASGPAVLDDNSLRAAMDERGLGGILRRIDQTITHASDWPARAGAAAQDIASWWTHLLALHRKARTLHKELKAAEQALGSEPSEENFLWLKDVQGRLAAAEGSEALIEGFGFSSGRPVRNL